MAEREMLLNLAGEIVSAHVSNHTLSTDQLPQLIQQVFDTLATVEQKTASPPKPEPAVPVKKSVMSNHIVCLDCGKHFSMLKRHLMTDHGLTIDQYRERWELPLSYPMVAHDYAKVRSTLAKKIGLGRSGSKKAKGARMKARR